MIPGFVANHIIILLLPLGYKIAAHYVPFCMNWNWGKCWMEYFISVFIFVIIYPHSDMTFYIVSKYIFSYSRYEYIESFIKPCNMKILSHVSIFIFS